MSSPELSRRIDRHEDDLRAVSDTVLDIKETVDGLAEVQQQHTAELTEIKTSVVGHTAELTEIKTSVVGHTADLAELKRSVVGHTADLAELKRSVVGHTADLAELKTSVAEILTLLRRNG